MDKGRHELIYTEPAAAWCEALPLGSGGGAASVCVYRESTEYAALSERGRFLDSLHGYQDSLCGLSAPSVLAGGNCRGDLWAGKCDIYPHLFCLGKI